jgi:hypothetical protein
MPSRLLPSLSVLVLLFAVHAQAQQAMLMDAPRPSESSSSIALDRNALNRNASNQDALSQNNGFLTVGPAPMLAFAVAPAAQAKARSPRLNWLDWSGIGAAAALRVLDYTSTEKALAYPQYFHEDILPTALVKNKPGFAAFQAGTVALNFEAYRVLVKHHRRPLALMSQSLYVGAMSYQVGSNYQLLGTVPGR